MVLGGLTYWSFPFSCVPRKEDGVSEPESGAFFLNLLPTGILSGIVNTHSDTGQSLLDKWQVT